MRKIVLIIIYSLLSTIIVRSQTFAYSGYVYNSNEVGLSNIPVKVYKRTTPVLTGFTSQTNYNGHSYYRSTSSMTWTAAKAACENMGGHLVTMSNAAENGFVFNTWPSGWIGYYQDNTGAFYSEPLGGWRWTEPYVDGSQQADYNVSSYTSGSTLTDVKSSLNATLYNSPTFTTGGGKYITFNGSNQYAITGNLSSKFPNSSKLITLQLWAYPMDNGVLVSELGIGSPSSGWHESVMEITGGNTLRVGFWNGTAITQLSTSITLNTWNLISVTYDGSAMRGYLNGVSFGSVNFTRDVPHAYSGNGQYFALGLSDATNMGDGTYANYRLGRFDVFNTALSADEINRNWMSTAYRFGRYPYSYWNGGEPNNSGSEDYAQFVGGGLWNDLPNTSLPYVLEFDYIVTTSAWVLETTIYTNSSGLYSISLPTNPSIERYIEISNLTMPMLTDSDAKAPLQIGLGLVPTTSRKYYINDVNNDSRINVADSWYIYGKIGSIFSNWGSSLPNYRLFNTTQWNAIKTSTSDLRATYPGTQTMTITSPVSGGTTNFYLLRTGYSN
jgi:hypothetical protein